MGRLPVVSGLLKAVSISALAVSSLSAENIVFPAVSSVKDVKTIFGARGDGKADDTEALRKAFKDNDGIIYLPNGTYRVSGSIVCKGLGIGPWIYGRNRDSVVIRLDDRAAGFGDTANPQPVIAATSHKPGGRISADQFFRQWHHFTVDAGNNPGAIGIRYYSNNSGTLHDVAIRGGGKYGLDLGWVDQNGPCLIRDLVVDGFDVGIYADRLINSQTLWGVTIRNSRRAGVRCTGQNLSIEDIRIDKVPLAMDLNGMVCIINGSFSGTDRTQPAIRNRGTLYARNLVARGFSRVLDSGDSSAPSDSIVEYSSDGLGRSFVDAHPGSLGLPVRRPPDLRWETDTAKWEIASDYIVVEGNTTTTDDTKSIQAAIDVAAARGATTACLVPPRRSPGYYVLTDDIHVHGSVRHILGLGFGRVLSEKGSMHGFVLDSNAAPVVKFENIYSFIPGVGYSMTTNNTSTLVMQDCDGAMVQASGKGDVFLTDCTGHIRITNPQAHVWARQWNTEGREIDSDNEGGTLWILGLKTERGGTKIRTSRGGRTELLGAHVYNTCDGEVRKMPLLEVTDASASFACVREVCYCGPKMFYAMHVKESRQGAVLEWHAPERPGSWGVYSGATAAAARAGSGR